MLQLPVRGHVITHMSQRANLVRTTGLGGAPTVNTTNQKQDEIQVGLKPLTPRSGLDDGLRRYEVQKHVTIAAYPARELLGVHKTAALL